MVHILGPSDSFLVRVDSLFVGGDGYSFWALEAAWQVQSYRGCIIILGLGFRVRV